MAKTVFGALLDARNLEQVDVADEVDLSPAMISMLATGQRKPSLGAAERIGRFLDHPIDGLFDLVPESEGGDPGEAAEPGTEASAEGGETADRPEATRSAS